jgi:hypothetical protein
MIFSFLPYLRLCNFSLALGVCEKQAEGRFNRNLCGIRCACYCYQGILVLLKNLISTCMHFRLLSPVNRQEQDVTSHKSGQILNFKSKQSPNMVLLNILRSAMMVPYAHYAVGEVDFCIF